jgi:hypothetical protein
MLQAESVRDAAWGCDWVGTPVPFQRCLQFIIATANKEFTLTAGNFVPVCNKTMMNVRKVCFYCRVLIETEKLPYAKQFKTQSTVTIIFLISTITFYLVLM